MFIFFLQKKVFAQQCQHLAQCSKTFSKMKCTKFSYMLDLNFQLLLSDNFKLNKFNFILSKKLY